MEFLYGKITTCFAFNPYRGLGIATELKKKAIEYSLRQGLRKMVTTVHKDNHRMLKVNKKLGFVVCK